MAAVPLVTLADMASLASPANSVDGTTRSRWNCSAVCEASDHPEGAGIYYTQKSLHSAWVRQGAQPGNTTGTQSWVVIPV